MQLQRLVADAGANRRNQAARTFRAQQAGWVFDIQSINVRRRGQLAGQIGIEGIIMHGTDGIGQRRDDLAATGLANHARGFQQ